MKGKGGSKGGSKGTSKDGKGGKGGKAQDGTAVITAALTQLINHGKATAPGTGAGAGAGTRGAPSAGGVKSLSMTASSAFSGLLPEAHRWSIATVIKVRRQRVRCENSLRKWYLLSACYCVNHRSL